MVVALFFYNSKDLPSLKERNKLRKIIAEENQKTYLSIATSQTVTSDLEEMEIDGFRRRPRKDVNIILKEKSIKGCLNNSKI